MATREQFLAVHQEAMDRGARCTECPLFKLAVEKGKGRGPVTGRIQANSKLVVIGEAPGNQEVEKGEIFVGASGRILDAKLSDGGLNRHVPGDVSLTNTLLCQPPDDFEAYEEKLRVKARKAGREAVLPSDCCYPRLKRDIQEANAPVEYAVGRQALKAVAHYYNVPYGRERKRERDDISIAGLRKQHGAPIIIRKPDHPDGAKVVIASYHPAYAMRGAKSWMPVIKTVIERAAKIATRGGVVDWTKPVYNLNPTLDQIEAFAREAVDTNRLVMVDIETGPSSPGATDGGLIQTCALRCIGWGFRRDPTDEHPEGEEVIMVVPYKDMAGQRIWHDHQYERLDAAIRLVMDEAQLAGQNFSFDSAVLLRLGLMTKREKRWADCYVESETEFLTEYGWRRFDAVNGARLATLSQSGRLEWQAPTGTVDRVSDEPVYEVETRTTRCVVTGGHRMLSRPFWRGRGASGDWSLTSLDELLLSSPDVREHWRAPHTCEEDVQRYEEHIALLLGLFISDGSFMWRSEDRIRGISISQKEGGRAEAVLRELQKTALAPCFAMDRHARSDKPTVECRWRVEDPALARQFLKWCGRYSSDMRLPPHALTQPLGVRRALMRGLVAGDGTEVGRSIRYTSTSEQLASDVHALALTLGWVSSVHRMGRCWCVSMRPDEAPVERVGLRVRTAARRAYAHVTLLPPAMRRVVCFEVPNRTLITRCRGRVAIHGNCMLAHHDTDSCDLPHDLGFIISEHFEAPHHKQDVDHKSINNVDYELLKQYNGDDVLTQLRCLFAVLARVEQLGTMPQFITDTKIAPICRDAGDLGLVIDEDERDRLSGVLTERIDHFRAKFRFEAAKLFVDDAELKRVEDQLERVMQDVKRKPEPERAPFLTRAYHQYAADRGFSDANLNPNSVYHLRTLFFDQLQLTPILNTDGWEFDEEQEDDPSTSQAAILKLMEKYDHIAPLCDALLEYRAYHKLYGTYVADKKGRIRDVDWTKWGLPPNMRKRVLNTVYKVHVIPSGRLSTQPAIQNWPAVGKANMRTMVVSPDGHTIVGADYDQLELRIYAVVAQDQLLLQAFSDKDKHGNPIDPHSLNAASLLAETEGGVWDEYYRIKYDMADKQRKYWRTVAKRFCVPSYTKVLTARGEVPIVQVRDDDFVWDGVEWVSHEGVIFNGYQEVITWDGLTATPDHKVWRMDGTTSTLEQAAMDGIRLARSGAGGQPIRFLDYADTAAGGTDDVQARKDDVPHSRDRAVRLRGSRTGLGVDAPKRVINTVRKMRARKARRDAFSEIAVRSAARNTGGYEIREVDHDHFALPLRTYIQDSSDDSVRVRCRENRPTTDAHRRQVDAVSCVREAQGHTTRPSSAPERGSATLSRPKLSSVQELRGARNRVQVRVGRGSSTLGRRQFGSAGELPRTRYRPNRQRRTLRTRQSALGDTQRQPTQQASGVHGRTRTLVPVYDLLNAGPRRRFTAENVIISNCYLETYGGEEEKLFQTMAASRDKATGKRDFPNLQPKDVEVWHTRWHKMHPETKRWQDNVKSVAYDRGEVRVSTLDRRARFWPGGIDKKNAPPNHTIQGFAASIANKALIELEDAIPHRGWSPVSGIILQVHDYIGAYVPRERAWEAKHLVEECLGFRHGGLDFTCTAEVSYRWSGQG